MEFNLYQYSATDLYEQWTRFPATVLGLGDNGPYVDLWRQVRRVFKDDEATTVNSEPVKLTTTLADVGDPATTSFPLLNPLTGETIGTMTVGEFVAAAYSLAIWLDQRVPEPVSAEPLPA